MARGHRIRREQGEPAPDNTHHGKASLPSSFAHNRKPGVEARNKDLKHRVIRRSMRRLLNGK